MGEFAIGQGVPRFEDPRLVRGEGRYVGDIALPGMAFGYVLRSPHARARILGIDIRGATALPGVLAVLTGEDVASDRLGTIPMTLRRKRPDGSPMFAPPHPGLVRDQVRYVGDPVAMVIAEFFTSISGLGAIIITSVSLRAKCGTRFPMFVEDTCSQPLHAGRGALSRQKRKRKFSQGVTCATAVAVAEFRFGGRYWG